MIILSFLKVLLLSFLLFWFCVYWLTFFADKASESKNHFLKGIYWFLGILIGLIPAYGIPIICHYVCQN